MHFVLESARSYVENCQGYFAKEADLLETSSNFIARADYLLCDALSLNNDWPVKKDSIKYGHHFSLCGTLDLTSFRHSLRPQLEGRGNSLTELFGSYARDLANQCSFEGEGRNFLLTGVLKVEGRGHPSRLWVWVTDEILDATYRSYVPVWFVFDETKEMWVADE